ncbi:MAG: ATPase, T2SS/T4P/T4SS family [Candidatus Omnitrophota bacterium]
MDKIDLGPIQDLINDPLVSEIMINGPKKIFAEKKGKKLLTGITFSGEEELRALLDRIFSASSKRVDGDVPYADVCLDDGTRINAIIPPLSRFGISVTFRKFSQEIKSLDDLIKNGTVTQKAADLLVACIKGKVNMIFSGGTGVGKTTTLQVLSRCCPPEERVITIEDAAELRLEQENVISLETKVADKNGRGEVTIRDLIRNALRMSPDRIIIGEVRGGEAIDMIQAMATGHTGTIGIVHGNSPRDVIARLETMILMSGLLLPLAEIRKMICSTINIIVHQERMRDGVRRVTYITEVRGIEREDIVFNDLFTFQTDAIEESGAIRGALKPSMRYYPLFFQRFQKMGLLSSDVLVKG